MGARRADARADEAGQMCQTDETGEEGRTAQVFDRLEARVALDDLVHEHRQGREDPEGGDAAGHQDAVEQVDPEIRTQIARGVGMVGRYGGRHADSLWVHT